MSNENPIHVLVTGGAGYIGSHTAKALKAAGTMPVVLDNLSRNNDDAVKFGPFIQADIADDATVRKAMRDWKVQAVLHFAGYIAVGESVRDPELYVRNNISGMERLISSCNAEGVKKFVFSSSAAVYGYPEHLPMTEETPKSPVSPYGATKLIGEQMLGWAEAAHGMKFAALRYFNAAGADPEGGLGERHDPETHLIPNIIRAALGKIPALMVFGDDYNTTDGTALRDYVHVSDLADAHVLALNHLLSGGDSVALNLGSGHGFTVLEVISAVERATGRTVPYEMHPRRSGDAAALYASKSKAKSILGWDPKLSDLAAICRTAYEFEVSRTP